MLVKQKIERLLVISVVLFLSGCVSMPVNLGISDSEWSSYSLEKQKKMLADSARFFKYHNSVIKKKKNDNANGVFLEVDIHSGQVMMPPFSNWLDYRPVSFIIFKGQCRDIILEQSTDKNLQTELGVCFYGNVLSLDPSRYDLEKYKGSINAHSSPLWLTGFSYRGVSSSGYVRLKDVTIKITQKEKKSVEDL